MRVLRSRVLRTLCVLVLVFGLAGTSTPAATRFEFLFSTSHVSNDNQYFLNLAVSNSGYSRVALEPVLPRLAYVERDLPVVLFLARESGRSVDFIVGLRAGGMAWAAVFDRCRVAPDVLFVGIPRDPGPPYGKAWGYWKNQAGESKLSDDDIAGLVHVQLASRWASTGAWDLAHDQGSRKRVIKYTAQKKGRPYKQAGATQGGKQQKSKGKGSAY